MKKISRFINLSNISRFRLIVQIIAFIILVYGGSQAISIGQNVPAFACPYNLNSGGTCYLISIQHQFHLPWKEFAGFRGLAIITGLLSFLLLFVLVNKAWCGFICPLGLIQDLITKLRGLFNIRYSRYSQKTFKYLKSIKYVLLVLMILLPFGISNPIPGIGKVPEDLSAPFCQLCPARTVIPTFNADLSNYFIDFSNRTTMIMSILAMIITGIFFAGSFFKKRFFCFFCPMSALQHLFSRIGFLRLVKDGAKCTKCGNCSRVCDMGISAIAEDVTSHFIVKDDCMMCFKCLESCPENDCLKVNYLGLKILTSTNEGFVKRYKNSKIFEDNNSINAAESLQPNNEK